MPDAHFERNKAMLRVSLLFTALACGDAFMAPVSKPFIATPRVATAPVMIFGFGGFGKSVSRGIRRGGFPKLTGGDGGAGAGGVGDGGEVAGGGTGDDDGKGENPLTVLWNDYVRLLDEKPLLMKALTSFTGFAIGDILAQTFIQKEEAFSW
jgi:protein Mpv17|tara:strand:- start:9 stop:464 length:456 start_codon:yes stop_codon:yes gene_type:complete